MATTPAKAPFLLFKYSVLLCTFFTLLAWLLLLGGISALEDICPGDCRMLYGLPWFIIWFQFVLMFPAFFIEFLDTFSAWRPTLNILLAINTVLAIIQTNNFLNFKDQGSLANAINATLSDNSDNFKSSFTNDGGLSGGSRVNATIAGFIILSIFNLLLIILSGSRTALHARYGEDRDVGVATYPSKTRPTSPTPSNGGASQVTVPPPQSAYGTTAPPPSNLPAEV